ncbi:MAG: MFS transporter [Rhodospirillales bacterium]|nr:MFS transporter [Rhodospirillales bacterium]
MSRPPAASAVTARHWLICALAWAVFATSFIDRLAWGNLQLQAGHSLGLGLAGLGAFVSAFYVGYVASNAVSGLLVDGFGPRLVLSLSTLLLGAATLGFGFVASAPAGLAVQAVMGVAAGADYAGCVKLLTRWFAPSWRGRAFGIWYTASSLAVVATNALVPVLARHAGWQGAYHALGAATLVLAVLCWIGLRDAPDRGATGSVPSGPPAMPMGRAIGALLADRDILLVSLAGFGALWGTWGFAFWSNALMVRGHGLAPAQAAGIVALFGIGAAIAKPLVGLISDRLGGRRKPPAMVCLAGFVVMLLVFGQLDSAAAFRLAAPFLGVTAFAYSPMTTALVAELAGGENAGAASGLTNAFWQLGNVLVPLAVGLVFQASHSFMAAFATLAAGPALAVAALAGVRERKRA